jgi:hypothetical protein
MGKSRRYRQDGAERRRSFTAGTAPGLPSLWQRAQCCGATIAADLSRMSRQWADVHEPGCPAPWEALGLDGPPRDVYPGAPWVPAAGRLRAVNRRPGSRPASPEHQAAQRRRA